jgi:glycosyltransferase involved in cell wall biosynthesis
MTGAFVSIIIPTRDSTTIDKTIASLFIQTAFKSVLEILVIGVDAYGLVKETPPVRFISTSAPVTAPVARNIGINQALGSVMVLIDSDCIAKPDWLASLLHAWSEGRQIVGGSVAYDERPYLRLCYNLTMFHEFLPHRSSGSRSNLGTLNLLVSRQVIDQVGLFDEGLPRCQDTEWTLRMRHFDRELYFEPLAIVRHLPTVRPLPSLLKLWYDTGFFSSRIRQKYPGLLSPPPFSKFPLLLILFSPVVAALVSVRIFLYDLHLLRNLHTLPVIFLTKVAWCVGAAAQALHDH